MTQKLNLYIAFKDLIMVRLEKESERVLGKIFGGKRSDHV